MTVLAWCLMASIGRVSSSIARGQRRSEVVDERAGRADLARRRPGTPRPAARTATSRSSADEPHRGAGLEVAVVAAGAQAVEEPVGGADDLAARHAAQHRVAVALVGHRLLDRPRAPRAAGGPRRRWPAPPRSRTGGRPSPTARTPSAGSTGGTVDRRRPAANRSSPSSAITIGVALWARKIATSLATSSAVPPTQPRRAHEDQRLGRQVDVLLVLGDVAGDRLVAELAELDPHLLGGDRVGAVADDRPVALRRCEPPGGLGDLRRAGRAPSRIAVGQLAQRRRAARGGAAVGADTGRLGDRAGQQHARGDLGVERLRRGDAHLDVATVGRVQHAVGLVGEVAAAAVDDADHAPPRAPAAGRRCGWCRWWCRSG